MKCPSDTPAALDVCPQCTGFVWSNDATFSRGDRVYHMLCAAHANLVDKQSDGVTFTGKVVDSTKRTNPKDAVGTGKVPMSTVPGYVMLEVGLAMLEGARKYGRHNYRDAGVRASVYYDALFRHMIAWWEGENVDPDSQLSHVTKAIATLVVLRDAMINDKLTDDRPPALAPDGCMDAMNRRASHLLELYPDAVAPHTEKPQ